MLKSIIYVHIFFTIKTFIEKITYTIITQIITA